jgi:hypothetical protein
MMQLEGIHWRSNALNSLIEVTRLWLHFWVALFQSYSNCVSALYVIVPHECKQAMVMLFKYDTVKARVTGGGEMLVRRSDWQVDLSTRTRFNTAQFSCQVDPWKERLVDPPLLTLYPVQILTDQYMTTQRNIGLLSSVNINWQTLWEALAILLSKHNWSTVWKKLTFIELSNYKCLYNIINILYIIMKSFVSVQMCNTPLVEDKVEVS